MLYSIFYDCYNSIYMVVVLKWIANTHTLRKKLLQQKRFIGLPTCMNKQCFQI